MTFGASLVRLCLLCLLCFRYAAPRPAFIATQAALLDAPRSLARLFPAPSDVAGEANIAGLNNQLTFDGLKDGAVFARPAGASRTGIPYTLTAPMWLVSRAGEQGRDNSTFVLCFTVHHMGGSRRSCSPTSTKDGWREGLLVIERLGRPKITAVLLKRATVATGSTADASAPLPASLLIAWATFRIRVIAEEFAVAHAQAPYVRRARALYTPSLLEFYRQDDNFASDAAADAALKHLIGSTVIVNLARRTALLSRLTNLLKHTAPLNRMSRISRQDAVDGASLDLDDLVREGILSQEGMVSAMQTDIRVEAIQLTRGAIGCALSHVHLWKQIAADQRRGATLILEDDVYFASDFEYRLREAIALLPANFSLLYLSLPDYAMRTLPIKTINFNQSYQKNASYISAGGEGGEIKTSLFGTTVRAVLGHNYGTSAYILSPAGARALLYKVMPLTMQIDSHIIAATERSVRREVRSVQRDAAKGALDLQAEDSDKQGLLPFDVYTVDPPLVYELKTLHKSDVQIGL